MRTPLKLENQEYSLQIPFNIIIEFIDQKFKDSGTNPEISLKMQVNTTRKKDRNTSPLPVTMVFHVTLDSPT